MCLLLGNLFFWLVGSFGSNHAPTNGTMRTDGGPEGHLRSFSGPFLRLPPVPAWIFSHFLQVCPCDGLVIHPGFIPASPQMTSALPQYNSMIGCRNQTTDDPRGRLVAPEVPTCSLDKLLDDCLCPTKQAVGMSPPLEWAAVCALWLN